MERALSGKSGDAYRTISEVAADLDLPQHVLRFWESRFPQIRPLKRGGGRRFYRPADVVLLRDIRRLLHAEGYTIKGVQRLLRERGGGGDRPAVVRDGEDIEDAAEASGLINHDSAVVDPPVPEAAAAGGCYAPPAANAVDFAVLHEALALVDECERRLLAAIAEAVVATGAAPATAPSGGMPPGR